MSILPCHVCDGGVGLSVRVTQGFAVMGVIASAFVFKISDKGSKMFPLIGSIGLGAVSLIAAFLATFLP